VTGRRRDGAVIQQVDVVYIDRETGTPRGAPSKEERQRMADRLAQALAEAVLGPGARAAPAAPDFL